MRVPHQHLHCFDVAAVCNEAGTKRVSEVMACKVRQKKRRSAFFLSFCNFLLVPVLCQPLQRFIDPSVVIYAAVQIAKDETRIAVDDDLIGSVEIVPPCKHLR